VILLATVAIVVAVVLMVWPTSQHDPEGKHTLAPPPAPERMQTEPEVKQPLPQAPTRPTPPPLPPAGATSDPWSQNQVDPPPADPGAHPLDSDDTDDADDLGGLQNPFASPNPPPTAPGRRRLPINGNSTMMLALMEHVCRKMVECNAGDPMTKSTCDALAHRSLPPPANCPAANRCLHLIDAMSCGSQADNLAHLSSLMLQLRDCTEAIRC
jgi:hypothetical protein